MAIPVRECKYGEVGEFRRLEGDYHCMGESHGAGDAIRLVFEEDRKRIALQTWAAACYALKPHDLEIGWDAAMRAKRGYRPLLAETFCDIERRRGSRRWRVPPSTPRPSRRR